MRRIFLILLLFLISVVSLIPSNSFASSAMVYFISGFPWELPEPESMTILTQFMEAKYKTAHFEIVHNSKWKKVCKAISDEKSTFPDSKIILAGHSFGGQGAITISHCLEGKKINVSAIIPIDPVHKLFEPPVDIVPNNVSLAFSFFQDQDALIHGNKHLKRGDETDTGITNTQIKIPRGVLRPHDEILEILVKTAVVQSLISNVLDSNLDP